jgi:hypothetical protein
MVGVAEVKYFSRGVMATEGALLAKGCPVDKKRLEIIELGNSIT